MSDQGKEQEPTWKRKNIPDNFTYVAFGNGDEPENWWYHQDCFDTIVRERDDLKKQLAEKDEKLKEYSTSYHEAAQQIQEQSAEISRLNKILDGYSKEDGSAFIQRQDEEIERLKNFEFDSNTFTLKFPEIGKEIAFAPKKVADEQRALLEECRSYVRHTEDCYDEIEAGFECSCGADETIEKLTAHLDKEEK